jgi:hypothetical protein
VFRAAFDIDFSSRLPSAPSLPKAEFPLLQLADLNKEVETCEVKEHRQTKLGIQFAVVTPSCETHRAGFCLLRMNVML